MKAPDAAHWTCWPRCRSTATSAWAATARTKRIAIAGRCASCWWRAGRRWRSEISRMPASGHRGRLRGRSASSQLQAFPSICSCARTSSPAESGRLPPASWPLQIDARLALPIQLDLVARRQAPHPHHRLLRRACRVGHADHIVELPALVGTRLCLGVVDEARTWLALLAGTHGGEAVRAAASPVNAPSRRAQASGICRSVCTAPTVWGAPTARCSSGVSAASKHGRARAASINRDRRMGISIGTPRRLAEAGLTGAKAGGSQIMPLPGGGSARMSTRSLAGRPRVMRRGSRASRAWLDSTKTARILQAPGNAEHRHTSDDHQGRYGLVPGCSPSSPSWCRSSPLDAYIHSAEGSNAGTSRAVTGAGLRHSRDPVRNRLGALDPAPTHRQ